MSAPTPAQGSSSPSRTTASACPEDQRDRLTEPYVTTRDKGTGLGLAIVKTIMEDHNADLILEDRHGRGARISLHFRPTDESTLEAAADGAASAEHVKIATKSVAHGT